MLVKGRSKRKGRERGSNEPGEKALYRGPYREGGDLRSRIKKKVGGRVTGSDRTGGGGYGKGKAVPRTRSWGRTRGGGKKVPKKKNR